MNVIYVKTFMPEKTDEKKFGEELEKFKKQTSVENEEPAEVYNANFMKSQNQTSRSLENKPQEVYILTPNNTIPKVQEIIECMDSIPYALFLSYFKEKRIKKCQRKDVIQFRSYRKS